MDIKIPKFVKILSIFFIIIFAIFMYMRFIGTSGLIVNEYKITNKNIPNDYHGLKIVHFTDIHYKSTTDYNSLKNVVNKINYINPDIVVFTGDIFDKDIEYTEKDIKDLTSLFKDIKASYRKYAILGKSDNADMWKSVINDSKFIDLNDNDDLIYIKSQEAILISGNQDKKVIISEDNIIYTYSILLTNNPENVKPSNNYDLILSGSSHGAQIKLPFIGGIIKLDNSKIYDENYYKIGNADLYISGGLGCTKLNLRFLNHPSINFYRLTNK